ncbi:hypothetical protein FRC20_001776 [Serendipita sp. 405]|nr:hypothetical protein FRC20_001776 [Serendipita sp. 405]
MLSLLDSINSKSYTEDIQTRIDKRVDEGFETIRIRTLNDQKRTMKDYFDACRALIASNNSNSDPTGGDPPSGPVPPPDNPSRGSQLPVEWKPRPDLRALLIKAIEKGKNGLPRSIPSSGKQDNIKTRNTVEGQLSRTASQLKQLHFDSKR